MAAIRTEKVSVESPAVEKKEGLLPVGQGLPDRLDQGAGEEGRQPPLVPLRPEIDHLDPGEGPVVDPGGEGQASGNGLPRRENSSGWPALRIRG